MIGSLLKYFIFAVFVLVLGNWVQWDRRTLSDHVRIRMAQLSREPFFTQATREIGQSFGKLQEKVQLAPPSLPPSEEILQYEEKELKTLLEVYKKKKR